MYERADLSELGGENACYLIMSTIIHTEFEGFDYESGDLLQLNYNNSSGYNEFLKEKIGVNYGSMITKHMYID